MTSERWRHPAGQGDDPSTPQASVGVQVGPYRVQSKLGEGGMGEVFRAFDTKLNRPVAIKFLPPELADAPAPNAKRGWLRR